MDKITTLKHLYKLALNRKAVIYGLCKRRVPAAFLINWQGKRLLEAFQAGVYEYKKKG